MLCRLVGVSIVIFAFAGQSLGFEVGAIIRKIDVDQRVVHVFANGRERTVKIAADAKIQDENGEDLSGGLGAKELKEGATVTLNVERWLIQSHIKADAGLNYDPLRGEVKAPLLLWGPYFWADGMTPRKSDGLIWERSDFVGDGTHPSNTGRQKVAEQLLDFFKTDAYARTWFVKK